MLQGLPHKEHAFQFQGFQVTIQILSKLLVSDFLWEHHIQSELASECQGNQDCHFNANRFLLSSQSATQTLAYDSWWLLFMRLNQHTCLLDLKSLQDVQQIIVENGKTNASFATSETVLVGAT
jgi:hypothetical protein